MTETTETYQDRIISIEEIENQPVVRVDDDRLQVSKLEDESYVTPYFPYEAFDEITDLVYQVIDNWAYVAPVVRKDGITEEEE